MDTELNDALQDAQQPDGTGTDQKPEPTLEDFYELERKNRELFARAKKAEEGYRKAKLEPAEKTLNQTHPADDPKVSERLDRIELKTEGFSDDEVDFLLKNGGKKALEDRRVKAGIEALRQQAKAEAATVDTDSAKSDVEKKFSKEQLASMSVSELEKILPKA